jgi:hypothetical protein
MEIQKLRGNAPESTERTDDQEIEKENRQTSSIHTEDRIEPKTRGVWPKKPQTDMNVAEWRNLLTKLNLLEKWQHVLDSLTTGFDQGIPEHQLGHLKWFTPDNHRSASEAKEQIENNLESEKRQGRIFGPFSHE